MTCKDTSKMKLSKSLLEMKFMKRTKEKVEQQLYQEEGEEYFGSHLTSRMKNESGRFIIEQSFAFCEQLRDGRVSYRGMNPDIERLMELEESARLSNQVKKHENDVSDEQMAKQWKSSNITTMGNKFKPKRQRNRPYRELKRSSNEGSMEKSHKFLKPAD